MDFQKYQALGNDFILIETIGREKEIEEQLTPDIKVKMCKTKYGIGADGIILLESSKTADYKMKLYNSDASEAELSGNGLRCLALFIKYNGISNQDSLNIETDGGITKVQIINDSRVKVWMPNPVFDRSRIPMTGEGECVDCELQFADGSSQQATVVSVGNPHCVIFKPVEVADALEKGPMIEKSKYFPNRVNVEFVEVYDKSHVRAIFYERGAGITEACGTGSCALVAAGIKTGRLQSDIPVKVDTLGGELLVTIREGFSETILEGDAEFVFEGKIDI